MPLSKCRWRGEEGVVERARERLVGLVSGIESDARDRRFRFYERARRPFEPEATVELLRCLSDEAAEDAVEVEWRQRGSPRERAEVERFVERSRDGLYGAQDGGLVGGSCARLHEGDPSRPAWGDLTRLAFFRTRSPPAELVS